MKALFILTFSFFTVQGFAQWSDWIAPDSANNLVNIYKHDDQQAIEAGKAIYQTICFVCHGDAGKGDGVQAPSLTKVPADLTSQKVQQQSDGVLFWKITTGNDPMLAFEYYTVEERWQVVTFLRSMAGAANTASTSVVQDTPAADLAPKAPGFIATMLQFKTPADVYMAVIMAFILFTVFTLLVTLYYMTVFLKVLRQSNTPKKE